MRVLVACEFSGIVRDAFIARGHDAVSCDLLPSESPGPHIQADHDLHLLDVIERKWDLMIAHPPCTYFTNSAVCWLSRTPTKPKPDVLYGTERWIALDRAARLFNALLRAPIPRIAIENPIPHRYAVERIDRNYDQLIQPYQFGHAERKATCLWLKNLPPLQPTRIVKLPEKKSEAQRLHHLSPGPNRWKERSRTYQGIADAMAEQWGNLPLITRTTTGCEG